MVRGEARTGRQCQRNKPFQVMRTKAKRAGPDGLLILENVYRGIAEGYGVGVAGVGGFARLWQRRVRQSGNAVGGIRLQNWACRSLSACRMTNDKYQGGRERGKQAGPLKGHEPAEMGHETAGHQ